jgi:hypothetical protein
MEDSFNKAVAGMQESPDTMRVFTSPICFVSANGLQRCVEKPSPYFPPNFVSKVMNGYSNLVQHVIRSGRRYASDILVNKNNVTQAVESSDDFWLLYEVPLMEGEAGGMMAFIECAMSVVRRLDSNAMIANICYGIALGMTFVIFFIVFAVLRRSILAETKYARGVLYMVPHGVLRECKAMIEYIETLYAAIS